MANYPNVYAPKAARPFCNTAKRFLGSTNVLKKFPVFANTRTLGNKVTLTLSESNAVACKVELEIVVKSHLLVKKYNIAPNLATDA